MVLVLGMLIILFQVSVGFADDCGSFSNEAETQRLEVDLRMVEAHQAEVEDTLLLCEDPRVNLRSVRPGFRCLTQSGHIFERVHQPEFGESWKSEQGLIWSSFRGKGTHQQAAELCRKLGGRLPSGE